MSRHLAFHGFTPKSYDRGFAYYAAGAAVKAADDLMADVIFLEKHPAWTWADLMATPDEVVAAIRILDHEKAKHELSDRSSR